MNTLEEKKENRFFKRRFTDSWFASALLAFLMLLMGQFLGTLIQFIPGIPYTNAVKTGLMYFEFWGIWATVLLYMAVTKKNRPLIKYIGSGTKGNNWTNLLLGLLIGAGMNCFCILIACLHNDIYLIFDSFQPIPFVIIIFAVFVQSSAEELVCRGFLYQRLRRSYKHPAVAIVGNSALFAALHLLNDGITVLSFINILVVGILFSLMVYYMDSIWCAMAAHAAWNFTQNIIFGLPNSGITVPFSVFKLDASTARNSFAYNVGFGIEGTIFADLVLILGCVLLFMWGRKKKSVEVEDE